MLRRTTQTGELLYVVVTEQGDLTEEQLLCIVEGSNRTIYSEYPVVGPGIVYSADSSVVDINPNTFNLYDLLYNDYLDGIYDRTEIEWETDVMVHCDYGWSGHCNGYYVSGIFNLDAQENEDIELNDEDDEIGKDRNYVWRIKTITHDGPK